MEREDFAYTGTIHRCFRCGYCKFPLNWSDVNNCPPYARFRMEAYSCGGRLWLARAWLEDRIEWSEHLSEILYSCTTCRNCVVKCPLSFNVNIVDMITAVRSAMVEQGRVSPDVKRFFTNIELYGNPYGFSRTKRDDWAEGTGAETYDGQEYLLFVGCAGSYDARAMHSAQALARILKKAGVSFGILGIREECDGNEIAMLGESGLFAMLAENNIALFGKHKIAKIITLSPHAYNAVKNFYPHHGGKYEVCHYTQVLSELVREEKMDLRHYGGARITYHDPCFLGRWNGEYDAPRVVLKAIPGAEVVEMVKNRDGALCCGGGAGNFIMDLLGGSGESPARRRIREAVDTGANLLAVACPKCLLMMEDAVKAEELEDRIAVKDISEILEGAGPVVPP